MAKDKKSVEVETSAGEVAVVEPVEKTPIVTSGIGSDVLQRGLSHISQLSTEMTIDERREAIRNILKETVEIPDRLDVMAGELLYEVRENEYWKAWIIDDPGTGEKRPYASFDEYSESELGIKKRKAYYLCSIYEKYVVELGLDKEILKDLDWSKAKELLPVITVDNWTELLDKLRTMSVKAVQEMVREMSGKAPKAEADSGKEDTKRLSFLLTSEQLENVSAALEIAKGMTGSDKPSNQLDLICMDFVAGAADSGLEGALSKLDNVVKHVERAFGVKIDIKEVDSDRYAALARTEESTGEEASA